MKKSKLVASIFLCTAVFFVSCSDEIDELTNTSGAEDTELSAQVDTSVEMINDVVVQGFEDVENSETNRMFQNRLLPTCALVTIEVSNTAKNVTIDFGTTGCEARNGRIMKGKIIMSYEVDFEEESLVINYRFDEFFIDNVQFVGANTATRVHANTNENPQYTTNLEVTVVFEGGLQATRIGTVTREWTEGVLNGDWTDNVFETTGAWTTTFSSGIVHRTTITTPLRREASCRYLVSGTTTIERTNFSGVLDFGSGTCDNDATFTLTSGVTLNISL